MMIRPSTRALVQLLVLVSVVLILFLLFPRAFAFVEMAARELRYLWWLILLLALAAWLLWAGSRRRNPPET
jgi:hypothetical protein